MSSASLESLGAGRFRLAGSLDASTVPDVLRRSEQQFGGEQQIEVDLAGVTDSDSTGLALLIEWLRLARRHNWKLRLANLPQQIQALARISEVEDLLAANGHSDRAHTEGASAA